MKTIESVSNEIHSFAKEAPSDIRNCTAMKVGQWGRQGDIAVVRIDKRPECWNVETTDQSRQVAVGQGEGSNHRAGGKVRVFWPESAQLAADNCPIKSFFKNEPAARLMCIGPVIEATEEWPLTHPKHPHHQYGAGAFLVVYQLDRRTMRRVQD